LLEIGLPTFFALILIFVRELVECTRIENATSWQAFEVNERLGRFDWMAHHWQMYFTPNSTDARLVMQLAVKQLNGLCHVDDCISG